MQWSFLIGAYQKLLKALLTAYSFIHTSSIKMQSSSTDQRSFEHFENEKKHCYHQQKCFPLRKERNPHMHFSSLLGIASVKLILAILLQKSIDYAQKNVHWSLVWIVTRLRIHHHRCFMIWRKCLQWLVRPLWKWMNKSKSLIFV